MTDWSVLDQISRQGAEIILQRYTLFSPLPPIQNEDDFYRSYAIRERLSLISAPEKRINKLLSQLEVAQNAFFRSFLIKNDRLRLVARFVVSRLRFDDLGPDAAYQILLQHNLLRQDEDGNVFLIGLERNRYDPEHKRQALELPYPEELELLGDDVLDKLPPLESFFTPVFLDDDRHSGIGFGLLRQNEKPLVRALLSGEERIQTA